MEWHIETHDAVIDLSPLGGYFDLATSIDREHPNAALPGISTVAWSALGLYLWLWGRGRLKVEKAKALVEDEVRSV